MSEEIKEKDKKKEKKVKLKSDKVKERERNLKILKITLLIIALFLILVYFLLKAIYTSGAFTVILDQELLRQKGIIMYESPDFKEIRSILEAPRPEVMDNISINWLPANINDESDGSHNGPNYIAYTFYIENEGLETNYWYSIVIDDVIKNVDEAVRVMVFLNGEKTVYAKEESGGYQYPDTKPFYSKEFVMMEQRTNMKPLDRDKFTVVIWVEGDDPDCLDDIIGGEMKMHMEITSERILEKGE